MLLRTLALTAFLLAPLNGAGPDAPVPGKVAPDFTLKNPEGKDIRLSSLKGKVVLLNFWATWCTGCKQEIPWFIDFQEKYKAQGLTVVGVSLDDEGWKVVKPYLAEHPMNYTVLLGNDAVAGLYGGVDALPTTLLIDRKGKITEIHAGVVSRIDSEKSIQELLAKK